MKAQLLNLGKFLLFLSIGLTILYLVYIGQEDAYKAQCALDGIPDSECSLLKKVIQDFGQANYAWVALVLLAFMVSNVARALRWNMLLENLDIKPRFFTSFWAVMLGYFANLGLPRMGEVVRSGVVSRYEGVTLEKAFGTVVVERIIDVLCLGAIVGLAFLLEFDTLYNYLTANAGDKEGGLFASTIIWILLGLGILCAFGIFVFRKSLMKLPLFKKVVAILLGFWEGILTVRKLKNPVLFLFYTLVIWLMYYLMTYLCFFAFEPTAHLKPIAGLMVFVFGAFGFVIPSPGGMGTFHFLTIQALAMYGIDKVEGFSYANISFFSVQLGCNIAFGLLALVFLPLIPKSKSKSTSEVPSI